MLWDGLNSIYRNIKNENTEISINKRKKNSSNDFFLIKINRTILKNN